MVLLKQLLVKELMKAKDYPARHFASNLEEAIDKVFKEYDKLMNDEDIKC